MLADELFVGQTIWSIKSGWCKVKELHLSAEGHYVIKTDEHYCWYTRDGKEVAFTSKKSTPQLFLENPFDPKDLPPCEFKEGEVVMVSDHKGDDWLPEIFGHIHTSSTEYPYESECGTAWKYCRKLNSTERGE